MNIQNPAKWISMFQFVSRRRQISILNNPSWLPPLEMMWRDVMTSLKKAANLRGYMRSENSFVWRRFLDFYCQSTIFRGEWTFNTFNKSDEWTMSKYDVHLEQLKLAFTACFYGNVTFDMCNISDDRLSHDSSKVSTKNASRPTSTSICVYELYR